MGTVIGGEERSRDNRTEEIGGGCEFNLLCALPGDCIAEALALTSPRDACRLSLVGSSFRSAADSDALWLRFLPTDLPEIVARSSNPGLLNDFSSKKQLYIHLCDHPLVIDGGNKSFSLEKSSGKICIMLSSKDLDIVWGDTPRYWRWTPHPDSRFTEVAQLIGVCWLEISGKISTRMLSPGTVYVAYLIFTLGRGAYGLEHQPVEVSVGIVGGESQKQTIYLDPDEEHSHRFQIAPRMHGISGHWMMNRGMMMMGRMATPAGVLGESSYQYPKQRADGWMEIAMGECFINGKQDGELQMGLMEIRGGHWKRGLIVEGIEIRPKG